MTSLVSATRPGVVTQALARPRVLLAAAAVAYIALTLTTQPIFVADAPEYARAAVAKRLGIDCHFLDFGHLLWKPLGYAVLSGLGSAPGGQSTESVVLLTLGYLDVVAWLAGLVVVLTTAAWIWRRTGSVGATAFGVGLLLCSKAFLNFAQVGTSYVPALACLTSGLLLLCREAARPAPSLLQAGLVGALLAG